MASSLLNGFGCTPNLRLCYADLIHVRKCRWSDLPGLEATRRWDRESADAPFQAAFSAPTTVFRSRISFHIIFSSVQRPGFQKGLRIFPACDLAKTGSRARSCHA